MWSKIKKLGNPNDSPDLTFIIKKRPNKNKKMQALLAQERQKLALITAS